MSSSRAGSNLTYSTIGDESSSVHGTNVKDSPAESSDAQVSNMVGWVVYKMYGIREVKGVVQSYNSETKIYEVLYRDGKSEKVTEDSLVRYLSPTPPEEDEQRQKAKPAIMNASNAGRKAPARKVTKRKRAPAVAAKQSRKAAESSGEAPAANSSKRGGTAAAKQSRKAAESSGEAPAAESGNAGKTRYRSLRMNAGH